jgi:hypothetical protein
MEPSTNVILQDNLYNNVQYLTQSGSRMKKRTGTDRTIDKRNLPLRSRSALRYVLPSHLDRLTANVL